MKEELEETKYLDWKGNIIQPEDRIKLICVEEPISKVLYSYEFEESIKDKRAYLIPNLYDVTKPINNYSLVPKVPGHKNIFKTVISYNVESLDIEERIIPVIEIEGKTCMFLVDYLKLANEHMKNCIVAIEGKSDNESEFYEKYFEL